MTKLKDENKPSTLCHQNMDKASIVQGTKIFNNTNVSAHACIEALTKLLYFIEQDNTMTSEEATCIFFSITKLFQFKHPILRRLSHVAIKSLSRLASDIIIATSCLMKDVTGDDQFIRASALRALCSITDAAMLPSIERYIKQAMVDRNSGVASAALVSSFRFSTTNPEFIKRWVNEITEICKNDSVITQYHALGLIYLIKKHDKYSLLKFFNKFLKGGRIAASNIFLIRLVCSEALRIAEPKSYAHAQTSLGRSSENMSGDYPSGRSGGPEHTRTLPREYEDYREVPTNTEDVRTLPRGSDNKRKHPTGSEDIRTLPNASDDTRQFSNTTENVSTYSATSDSNRTFINSSDNIKESTTGSEYNRTSPKNPEHFREHPKTTDKIRVYPKCTEDYTNRNESFRSSGGNLYTSKSNISDYSRLLEAGTPNSDDYLLIVNYLEGCLHNRAEMVILEACRAIASLPIAPPHLISQVVSIMRIFLSSPKHITRYCAVSTLCHMSTVYPAQVSECAVDLESMLSEDDKGLATFAVTALLKVGSESNIDRVIKLISAFISEISEAYRIIIVKELRNLILKYPSKSQTFLSFITAMLREEGGIDYKQSLINLVITIINECSDLKEDGLLLLCEFIEDCDHHTLMNNILQIISIEGPTCKNPSQFIRFIYNRIMLEAANIRASAIVCLAQFAIKIPSLRPSILTIIKRCFYDNDDEVRDRACFYYALIKEDADLTFMTNIRKINIDYWLRALDKYLVESDGTNRFDISYVDNVRSEIQESIPVIVPEAVIGIEDEEVVKMSCLDELVDLFSQLERLYKFSHSTTHQQLSDVEEEFDVKSYFHIFDKIIVFEFIIFNSLDGHKVKKISIDVNFPKDFSVLLKKGCEEIGSRKTGKCFIFVKFPKDPTYISDTFNATMIYSLFKLDASKNWSVVVNNDQYSLDNIELNLSDHFKPMIVMNFETLWDEISEEYEVEETCALDKYPTIKDAAAVVIKLLGLSVFNKTDEIDPKSRLHRVLLAGKYRTGVIALARVDMKQDRQSEILIKMTVRCTDPCVSENIFSVLS